MPHEEGTINAFEGPRLTKGRFKRRRGKAWRDGGPMDLPWPGRERFALLR